MNPQIENDLVWEVIDINCSDVVIRKDAVLAFDENTYTILVKEWGWINVEDFYKVAEKHGISFNGKEKD